MSKILVAYFSATGTTAKAARAVADACRADLFEIKPAQAYSSADLNWTNPQSRSSLDMKDPDCRPALAFKTADLTDYDVLIVGFPIWWGVAPRPVDTFLDSIQTDGKRVIAFCTSGGSDSSEAFKDLKSRYPRLHVESVKLLTSSRAASQWVRSLDI